MRTPPSYPSSFMNIFSYQNYRNFLKDFYSHEKKKNSHFSHRYFALKASLPAYNYLKLVSDGKRNLTHNYLKKFIKGLNLKGREADYFSAMVMMNQARDVDEKSYWASCMLAVKEKENSREILKDQFDVMRGWQHWVIREMTNLPDFKDDPQWIALTLDHVIKPYEAERSLEILKKLNLIKKTNGKWQPTDQRVKTPDEVDSLLLKKLHEAFLRRAIDAIYKTSVDEREYFGLTIGIPQTKIKDVKEKIKDFLIKMDQELSLEKNPDEIYQFNIQFFPLTRNRRVK